MPRYSFFGPDGHWWHGHTKCEAREGEVFRACCVDDARRCKEVALRCATSRLHYAYQGFRAAWEKLTPAERQAVGNIRWDARGLRVIESGLDYEEKPLRETFPRPVRTPGYDPVEFMLGRWVWEGREEE